MGFLSRFFAPAGAASAHRIYASTSSSMKPLQTFTYDEIGLNNALDYLEATAGDIGIWIENEGPNGPAMNIALSQCSMPGFSVMVGDIPEIANGDTAFLVGHPEAPGFPEGRYTVDRITALTVASRYASQGTIDPELQWGQ
jgi:hypothetical protein